MASVVITETISKSMESGVIISISGRTRSISEILEFMDKREPGLVDDMEIVLGPHGSGLSLMWRAASRVCKILYETDELEEKEIIGKIYDNLVLRMSYRIPGDSIF